MSRSTTPPPADHLAVAHARLRTWIGIDPARGGIGRAVARHVATRVDALGRPSSEEYARRLSSPRSEEGQHLVRAATVPHSWLARHVEPLEELLARLGERGRTAHVWVAGCAGGEEVYTLAALGRARGVPLTVLGTDVNDAALRRAARGRYDAWTARALPPALRPWLADDGRGGAVATATLREGVAFAHHSLLSAPPPAPDEGGWDAVVCRNVLIYFPRAAALSTVGALRSALGPEGMLVLGASDVLAEVPRGLAPRPERRSFFERVGGASGAPEGRAPNVPRRPALATAPGRARAAARPDPVVTHASAGVPEATSVAPA
ncbi:MAG TPA: CheR family methyltransferase, partial [Sandaracinaceae bacterium LLY-WYZ-13_1]|nr:CheR family methyltransferase [Sandaracinaceae bacterium LLY-WYZ-13_1]